MWKHLHYLTCIDRLVSQYYCVTNYPKLYNILPYAFIPVLMNLKINCRLDTSGFFPQADM